MSGRAGENLPAGIGRVRTVQRAMAVLAAFSHREPTLNLKQVAERANLDGATALRMLSTLCDFNIVERLEDGRYGLGLYALELAQICTARFDIQQVALPHMRGLSAELDETVFLSIRSSNFRVAIAQVESSQEFRRTGGLGTPIPLHRGAPSRALLAFETDTFIAAYIERVSALSGDGDDLRPADLLKSLREIRKRGWAESQNERGSGGAGIAAPLFNHGGEVIASLAVAVPVSRWPPIRARASAGVRKAARAISKEVGYVHRRTA